MLWLRTYRVWTSLPIPHRAELFPQATGCGTRRRRARRLPPRLVRDWLLRHVTHRVWQRWCVIRLCWLNCEGCAPRLERRTVF